jgi:nitrous oxidase accessory protein NosD
MDHYLARTTAFVAVLGGLVSCKADSPTRPEAVPAVSTNTAGASTLVVDDAGGDCPNADFATIQAAVTAAEPGTTILVCAGTYKEQVTITKSHLRLLAKGQPGDVVLDGLGLAARLAGFFLNTAHDNLIEGFLLRNYHEASILLVSSNRNRIRKNVTTAADHDGIQVTGSLIGGVLVGSNDNVIEHNVVRDNLAANACGVNVAAGSQRNVVRHNLATNNEWGIQIIGGTTLNNEIFRNETLRNRGNGIRNVNSASGTIIEDNRAFDNGFAPSAITGTTNAGIRIGSGTGIVVRRNHAFDNLLFDLRNDAGAGATFENNHCRTSVPPGLCEHTEGQSPK